MNMRPNPMITKPGIYPGIPLPKYHLQICDGPSVSSSNLRTLSDKSAAHMWDQWSFNEDYEPRATTASMTLGQAAHHLLLGEDDFSTQFIARPEMVDGEAWHGNRKACKAWLNAQEAAARTVITPDQIGSVRGMARSLGSHSLIRNGILNGDIEQSMFAKHSTGIWVKTRTDARPTDSDDFVDLKTTTSVDYFDLSKTIAEYGYHQQGALMGAVYKAITGRSMTSFSLVFVETKRPFCTRVVTLKDGDLKRGHEQNEAALAKIAECLETGLWPGPDDGRDADYIELPEWRQKQIDERLKYFTEKPKKKAESADNLAAG